MKNFVIGLLVIIILFLAVSAVRIYSAPENAIETPRPSALAETKAPAVEAASWDLAGHMEVYRSVLLEGERFYSATAGGDIDVAGLGKAVSSDEKVLLSILRFALVDMDGDSLPELLLWLKVNNDDYYGYELIRREGDKLYGYTVWYRAMSQLKEDGSFVSSGGASDCGFGRMRFQGSDFDFEPQAFSRSQPDFSGGLTTAYYIGSDRVDKSAFDGALAAQDEKQAPEWYDCTEENILEILK